MAATTADPAPDPFGTAALRARVLAGWSGWPARFREDANAEDDYALGGYRDRLVVELAQNAADAAARAGVPGRLRLQLAGDVLTAANAGEPLTAAGVESLSTLRASAKRDQPQPDRPEQVGRFGVGFSAVVSVTDAPAITSATGAVRWSRELTAQACRELPALAAELAHRAGHVPVLRLPFPADTADPELQVPAGFTTLVRLPLRDPAAVQAVARMLAEVSGTLLLALPALVEVEVLDGTATRTLVAHRQGDLVLIDTLGPAGGNRQRWRVEVGTGRLPAEQLDTLLADRPAEERLHGGAWSVRWAVPLDDDGLPAALPADVPAVVHAPTPTDDPLVLPALLIATLPLEPTRRRVAAGPLRDVLLGRCADVYAALLTRLAPELGGDVLALVPGPGTLAGEVDAALRGLLLARLREAPLLPAVEGGLLAARDATVVEQLPPAAARGLAEAVPGLSPVEADTPSRRAALAALGVRRLPLADAVDALAGLRRDPTWWYALYAGLAELTLDGPLLEALGGLPVPLADGRLVRGPRGVLLLPGTGGEIEPTLAPLGLRLVDPQAAHPLLARLGAVSCTADRLLDEPAVIAAVQAAVHAGYDAQDDQALEIADAVLTLLAAAGGDEPGSRPWLGELLLPDAEGGLAPARELVLPGSAAAQVLGEEAVAVASALLARTGPGPLVAAGVLATLPLVRGQDLPVDPGSPLPDDDPLAALPDLDGWLAELAAGLPGGPGPVVLPEVLAVGELDLVDSAAWPQALGLLAQPPLRAALLEPAHALLADGRRRQVEPYTRWWLRRHARVESHRLSDLRLPGADPALAGLYRPIPPALAGLDPAVLAACGVRCRLADLLAEPGGAGDLLTRLAEPDRQVGAEELRALYAALAEADPEEVEPPEQVRVPTPDGGSTVLPAAAACVLDGPAWLPLAPGAGIAVPPRLAEPLAGVLGLALASEQLAPVRVCSAGEELAVPAGIARVLPRTPRLWWQHDELRVSAGAGEVALDWWVEGKGPDSQVHAATLDGLARGLAWAAGAWGDRLLVAALLAEPDQLAQLLAERGFDD